MSARREDVPTSPGMPSAGKSGGKPPHSKGRHPAGKDTGEITRHRAFYIIDRSIPVGFVRGQDLNTNNAVLLRRFIE